MKRQHAVVRPGFHPSRKDWSAFRASGHNDVLGVVGGIGFVGVWGVGLSAALIADYSNSDAAGLGFFALCVAVWAAGGTVYARWVRNGRKRAAALEDDRNMLPMWLLTVRNKEFWHRRALLVEARENARLLSTDLGADAVRELDALEWQLATILADVKLVQDALQKPRTDTDTVTAEKTLVVLKEALRRTNEQIESLADSITAALEMEGVAGPSALASIKARAEGYLLPPESHTRELLDTYTHAIEQVSQPTREASPLVRSASGGPTVMNLVGGG